jgi:WD40-like Beta Propeller Repeat
MKGLLKTIVLGLALVVTLPSAAQASFPGQNGKLLFEPVGSNCLSTVEPDGTGVTGTAVCPFSDTRFSPDGTHVVYSDDCIAGAFVTKLDGSDSSVIDSSEQCYDGLAWSPAGDKIVLTYWFEGSQGDSHTAFFTIGYPTYSRQDIDTRFCYPPEECPMYLHPDWSPDGSRIAFDKSMSTPEGIYTVVPTGGSQTFLAGGADPSWSPDATRIAFTRGGDIWVMTSSGSPQVNVTNSAATDSQPTWSPDGRKIAFTSTPDGDPAHWAVWTMNADGGGAVKVTDGTLADWQPIPYTGYPRPKGATPLRVPLVPAFNQCVSPNRTHRAPLAFPSCAPPSQASSNLTIGTPDANGKGANSSGYVRFAVGPGDPSTTFDEADVGIKVSLSDVRWKSDLSDYTGELQVWLPYLRITDKFNGPSGTNAGGTDPATMQDIPLPVTASCAATDPPTIGANCTFASSLEAIVPGMVKEGQRSVWQLSQVQVYDGGPDGAISTSAGNTLFMVQGVFVP